MKYKVTKYRYEKVSDTENEIEIPEVPEYHFQTGVRRSIAIIPEWTDWNKEQYNKEEEVWRLVFVMVYLSFECKIEVVTLDISSLSDVATRKNNDNYIGTWFLNHRDKYSLRTKEQFETDYTNALSICNDHLAKLKPTKQ